MKRNETIVIQHRLHVFACVRKYPQKATPREAIPSIAPKSVAVNPKKISPLRPIVMQENRRTQKV